MNSTRRSIPAVLTILLMIGGTMTVRSQEKSVTSSPEKNWDDAMKNPVDWFVWGADMRLRHESTENSSLTDADPPGYTQSFERLRLREWNTFSPWTALEFNIRFTWEGRHYWLPASKAEWDRSEIVFDNINGKVKFREIPVMLTVGRQDIVFGDGWLVSDGTPLDGPRTTYFDAVRVTVDLKEIRSALDLVYIDQASRSDRWSRPIFSKNISLMEQDERGAIVNMSMKLNERTQIEPYVIYKHDRAVLTKGDNGDVFTIGSRLDNDFDNNISCHVEGAYQFGERKNTVLFPGQDSSLSAFGFNSRITYSFRDRVKSQLWIGYAVLSGNDARDAHNHQFDPLWGRWAQYSELFPNDIDRPGDRSNLQRINLGCLAEPANGMSIQANYSALFVYANRFSGTTGFSDNGKFKGQLFTALVKYQYNRYWSGLLLGEYFIPGNYYETPMGDGPLHTRNQPASFLRTQVVFTF
ncbi:MAG TPA: alginate export family protein [Bacteroidota bacterium]|nr:alginate export family protein [Bacteroidota bacterium]